MNDLVAMKTPHFPIFHPKQANMPIRSAYAIGTKSGIGERSPNLYICVIDLSPNGFYTKRHRFVVTTGYFKMYMQNSNRCDKILEHGSGSGRVRE